MQSVQQASVFLGVDAHAEHCTFCAIDKQGKILVRQDVPSNVRQLRSAARKLPERTWAMVEASSMSVFVAEALVEVLDRVIVCETRENRLIYKSDDKSDDMDAWRLARLLRMGEFKEVHVPARPRQEIRELVYAYQRTVGDMVRAKNRIRAMLRKNGVHVTDSTYGEGRGDAMKQLNRPGLKAVFDAQYAVLDAAEKAKDSLDHALRAKLSHTREYKLLKTIPGVGSVFAAIMVAVIDRPERFPDKRHLWSYAGIGASERSSSKVAKKLKGIPVQMRGQFHGNRLLKYAVMMAAQNVIRGNSRFGRFYKARVEENEDPTKVRRTAAMARKTVARGILATALAMWKTGTAYREDVQAKAA